MTDKKPEIYLVSKSVVKSNKNGEEYIDPENIEKHIDLPAPASYKNPKNRPLIVYPERPKDANFNMYQKSVVNQQIRDGLAPPSAAVRSSAISPFGDENKADQFVCVAELPNMWVAIRDQEIGPSNVAVRSKPGVLSRVTDFDLLSQW